MVAVLSIHKCFRKRNSKNSTLSLGDDDMYRNFDAFIGYFKNSAKKKKQKKKLDTCLL